MRFLSFWLLSLAAFQAFSVLADGPETTEVLDSVDESEPKVLRLWTAQAFKDSLLSPNSRKAIRALDTLIEVHKTQRKAEIVDDLVTALLTRYALRNKGEESYFDPDYVDSSSFEFKALQWLAQISDKPHPQWEGLLLTVLRTESNKNVNLQAFAITMISYLDDPSPEAVSLIAIKLRGLAPIPMNVRKAAALAALRLQNRIPSTRDLLVLPLLRARQKFPWFSRLIDRQSCIQLVGS